MSNFNNEHDKIKGYLEELRKKHRNLDEEIKKLETIYNVNENIRRLKTHKLFLKDEIYRLESQLISLGTEVNGYH